MSGAALVTRALAMRFGGLLAIAGLDLVVEDGAIHSVIGPNGAGKTTLFDCITQFARPSAGEVLFHGRPIQGLSSREVARAGISRTYQNIRLFRHLTAMENLLVGMHLHLSARWWHAVLHTRAASAEEAMAREEAVRLLAFVGLRGRGDLPAASLSYGEQRRLEIGRALATRPRLLLLDEPTAGMNPRETADMIDLVRALRASLGITILLIEHRMRVVMSLSDRITVLERGSKIAEGTPSQVRADSRVAEAYLGNGDAGSALAARRLAMKRVA